LREYRFITGRHQQGFTLLLLTSLQLFGHLMHDVIHQQRVSHSFSFGPSCYPLLRPLLTSRSVSLRRPFRHEARSPQVRTHSFTAQPPDLRHTALATRASQFHACSPCSVTPLIRFLSIGSQFRSTLPSHSPSPFCSCASLHSL